MPRNTRKTMTRHASTVMMDPDRSAHAYLARQIERDRHRTRRAVNVAKRPFRSMV